MNRVAQHNFKKLALALAIAAPLGMAHARTPSADDLFNWAEQTYGAFFTGNPTTNTDTYAPFVFRAYSNGNYLAVNDEQLYLLGPLSAGQLMPLGSMTSFACFVYPSECGQGVGVGTGAELLEVKSFLSRYDTLWAASAPASGTLAVSMSDGCYLKNGWTSTMNRNTIDSDVANWKSDVAYLVGSKHTNVAILAVRNSANTDGSARREIDLQYDINYADGTTDSAVRQTLISGSSSGSCTTPQTDAGLRWFGNRQLAGWSVAGRNIKYRNYKLADGSLNTSTARRELAFYVSDPLQTFTYAVVTGAGPSTTIGGVAKPFSLKLVSPRILSSDALLAGKLGNFTNWKLTGFDLDVFRTCKTATSSAPHAELADCAGQGASGNSYGYTQSIASTTTLQNLVAADNGFNAYGFDGKYTVALYNDDGWKTVNGQAGKTPIATYTTNDPVQLPFTFASLSSTSATGFDPLAKYPGLSGSYTYNPVNVAALLRSGTGGSSGSSIWVASIPINNGGAYRMSQVGEYFEGAASTAASYPAQRWYNASYPGVGSTQASIPITASPSSIVSKRYSEFEWWFSNRNGGRIGLVHTYQ
ncbi:MAG: hypothetical protein WCH60_12960 [Burkholderiales bacterium]